MRIEYPKHKSVQTDLCLNQIYLIAHLGLKMPIWGNGMLTI